MEKILHFIATCPNMDDGCYQLRNWSHSNINSSHCNCQIKGGHLARRQRLFFTKKGAELGRQLCIHKWSIPSLPEILKATTKSAFIIYARIRRRHKRFKGHTALIRARNTPQAQNIPSKAGLALQIGMRVDDGRGRDRKKMEAGTKRRVKFPAPRLSNDLMNQKKTAWEASVIFFPKRTLPRFSLCVNISYPIPSSEL